MVKVFLTAQPAGKHQIFFEVLHARCTMPLDGIAIVEGWGSNQFFNGYQKCWVPFV